jgi:hypothetical protein
MLSTRPRGLAEGKGRVVRQIICSKAKAVSPGRDALTPRDATFFRGADIILNNFKTSRSTKIVPKNVEGTTTSISYITHECPMEQVLRLFLEFDLFDKSYYCTGV